MCDFLRDTYEWNPVHGHVRATHCYASRIPNERLNIPLRVQYHGSQQTPHPGYIKTLKLQSALQYKSTESDYRIMRENERTCMQRDAHYDEPKDTIFHLDRRKTPNNNDSFCYMVILSSNFSQCRGHKVHPRLRARPSHRAEITPST